MLKRCFLVCVLLSSVAILPARADDVSARMDQLEEQIRQLTGQVEQLTFQLKQVQAQSPKRLGTVETAPTLTDQAVAPQAVKPIPAPAPQIAVAAATTAPVVALKKKPALPVADASAATQGVEAIGETADPAPDQTQAAPPATSEIQVAGLAPVAKPVGLGTIKTAQPKDGGFQGKVLVAPNGIESATTADDAPAVAQQVSLQPETPDDLFLRSQKLLLQLQYADAEKGFKDFIAKYPDHNLVGAVYFWLGETYWAEQNYTSSSQAYLDSYKNFPKSRRAPDSLLKLGLSLARLGQKDQACTAIGSVGTEFPSAVEVKKRAQAEFKREGC